MTEKAFKILDTNLIPVVHGGANYTKSLPPGSFIDVRDYPSPQHLAKYLKHLIDNPDEFIKYLKWKAEFEVLHVPECKQRSFCRLCEILYDENYPYKSGFDPAQYWSSRVCLQKDEERKAVHLE